MQKFALIGFPLHHSFSPKIHSQVYRLNGIDASYSLIEIKPDDFPEKISGLKRNKIDGFNITIPFKSKIITYLDQIDSQAKKIGAVNTVKVIHNKWHGYNTDVDGFLSPLKKRSSKPRNCLIIGNGGAARAAIYALLKNMKTEKLVIAGRNINKVTVLKNEFSHYSKDTEIKVCHFNHITDYLGTQDLIINTTPIGMFPFTNESPLPDRFSVKSRAIFYDLIYNPVQTKLLADAQAICKDCIVINGMQMLVAQAVKSINIWTGKEIFEDDIYKSFMNESDYG